MKLGDIVQLKAYKNMAGKVTAIDDMDRVTIHLQDTGVEILVAMCYVEVIEEAEVEE